MSAERLREIVLDTETTGLDPLQGHRVVEIGCVELINGVPTGRHYHCYLNPERDVPAEAARVHGLTYDFLKEFPVFSSQGTKFLEFIAESPLVIHNAEFDLKFLNYELSLMGLPPIPSKRATDTILIARRMFPGAPASLDALCRRFGINNSHRDKHGALLDCHLLAEVYLHLLGGRQRQLVFESQTSGTQNQEYDSRTYQRKSREPRAFPASALEKERHEKFLSLLKDPIWVNPLKD